MYLNMGKKILHTTKIKRQLVMVCVTLILLMGLTGYTGKSPKPKEAMPIETLQEPMNIENLLLPDSIGNTTNDGMEDTDGSTAGLTIAFRKETYKNEHKIEVLNKEILSLVKDTSVQKLFQTEIRYWKNFSSTYIDYLDNIVCLSHFAGSICTPLWLYMVDRLYKDRIREQIWVCNLLKNKEYHYVEIKDIHLLELFGRKTNEAIIYGSEIGDYFKDSDFFPDATILYDSTYQAAKQNCIQLQSKIANWNKIREEIEQAIEKHDTIQSKTYRDITSNYIYKLCQYPDSVYSY